MSRHGFLLAIACSISWCAAALAEVSPTDWFEWSALPELPERLGVAGALVGCVENRLVVAGGSNFPVPLANGGQKAYHDRIFVLQNLREKGYQWKDAGRLKSALAHGATVSTSQGLICLGGRNARSSSSGVFILSWDIKTETFRQSSDLPSLPEPCDYLSAAILDGRLYVAGGKNSDGSATKHFWMLQLGTCGRWNDGRGGKAAGWKELPAWPGPPRFGAGLVVQGNGERECVYLFGGKSESTYLRDAYCYLPGVDGHRGRWKRLADMPRAALLAPVAPWGQSHVLVLSGSDGHDVDSWRELGEEYRFASDILAYHTITNTWTVVGNLPYGVAGTTAVPWQQGIAVPSGELRPGVRTPKVVLGEAKPFRSRIGLLDYAAIGGYLAALVVVGFCFARREKTCSDFFLGSHRIPWWAAGLSLLATQVSSIGFMAVPAKSYATNWAYLVGVATWFLVVPLVNRAYIPFFRRLNVTSAYEYLELRFHLAVRLFGTVVYSLLQMGRMAIVLYLPALALSTVTGIDTTVCILIMGLLCTAYTVAGGIEAVIWTDVVQACVLIGGALLCVVIVMADIGGPSRFFRIATADDKFQLASINWDYTSATLWVIVVGNFFTRLGNLTSDQAVVQRYLTTPDELTARRALWTDVITSIPWAVIVFLLGTALYVFYKLNPGMLDPTLDTDAVVPLFVSQRIPPGLAGLIIAAVFAAAMSSFDSSIHSVATIWTTDGIARFWPNSSDKTRLRWARGLTLLLGLLGTGSALWMTTMDIDSVWDQFWILVGLFIGGLTGLFVLGIFTRRTSASGALIGAVCSAAVLWYVVHYTEIHFFLYSAIGCMTCCGVGYLISLRKPHSKRLESLTVFDLSE